MSETDHEIIPASLCKLQAIDMTKIFFLGLPFNTGSFRLLTLPELSTCTRDLI